VDHNFGFQIKISVYKLLCGKSADPPATREMNGQSNKMFCLSQQSQSNGKLGTIPMAGLWPKLNDVSAISRPEITCLAADSHA
jgi:hypothetical protein